MSAPGKREHQYPAISRAVAVVEGAPPGKEKNGGDQQRLSDCGCDTKDAYAGGPPGAGEGGQTVAGNAARRFRNPTALASQA